MFRIDTKKITGYRIHREHIHVVEGLNSLILPGRTTHYIKHEDSDLLISHGNLGLGVTLRNIRIEAINLKLEGDCYITDSPIIISGDIQQMFIESKDEYIDTLLFELLETRTKIEFAFEENEYISGYITEISTQVSPKDLLEEYIKITLMSLS